MALRQGSKSGSKRSQAYITFIAARKPLPCRESYDYFISLSDTEAFLTQDHTSNIDLLD